MSAPLTATPADEVVAAINGQMKAWNAQDLEGALSFYWDSKDMTWVNRQGVTFGMAEFAKAMRDDFKDTSKMGHFEGKVIHTKELAPDLVLAVFNWKITGKDGKKIMGGVSTQLWRKTDKGWKAVYEHAS